MWRRTRRARHALFVVLVLGIGVAPSSASRAEPAPERIWVWAWERPEDLRFLAGRQDVGVAFLAATARIRERDVELRRRAHPVRIAAGARRLAVVRIERRRGLRIADEPRVRDALVAAALEAASLPRVEGVQLDYDARASERAFYTRLLRDVRAALPRGRSLTITALASWCLGDDWLADAAPYVDGVVPMVFTMGPDGAWVHARLAAAPFDDPRCHAHLGVAAGEPQPPRRGADLWLFSPRPWTPGRFHRVLEGSR